MDTPLILACLVVAVGGLFMGSGAWPFKLMRKYQFEHWWLIGTFFGLVVLPWTITLVACPDALGAIRSVWATNSRDILFANLLSTVWGVANVLCGLCFVRIGVRSWAGSGFRSALSPHCFSEARGWATSARPPP
jgi:L-rhamnose-H+ transport protein